MKNYKKKFKALIDTCKTTIFAFDLVWKEKKGKLYILLKGFYSIFNAFIPLINVIMPGLIINELTNDKNIRVLCFYIGVLLVTPALNNIVNVSLNNALTKLSLDLNLKFVENFYDYVLTMDYETIENPDIQKMKERAQTALSGVMSIVDILSSLLLAIVSLITISSIIMTLNSIIIFLVLLVIIINSVMAKYINKEKHLLSQRLSEFDLFQGAYIFMLQHFSYAKEIRLFGIKKLLIDLFSKSKIKSNKLEFKYRTTGNKLTYTQTLTNLIQQLVLYIYLVYKVINNSLAIGSMTIYLSSVNKFSSSLSSVFNAYVKLVDRGQKTQELMDFLKIPNKVYMCGNMSPHFNDTSIFEFKNVSFKYPGSDRYAIKNMNIKIVANEKLCIVGKNGSGKSTFIKLLLRLYYPTEGEILLNGININKYDYKQYIKIFAPVFQDFVSYTMTLKENIILSKEDKTEKLDEICKENGLSSLVSKLPKGYNTQIGKWLDPEGIDPSGGEEQRIAIARACYHGGDVFVLDEPTAAIDPFTEYEIYTRFNEIITGKSAILITHRLSAVQLADKIAVFNNGMVAEYGTHDELYKKNGIYTDMFDKQACFYRENK